MDTGAGEMTNGQPQVAEDSRTNHAEDGDAHVGRTTMPSLQVNTRPRNH